MSVTDRNIVDQMIIDENKNLKLLIFDHLQWNCVIRANHTHILQNKINDYLNFIGSGQIDKSYDSSKYDKIVITLVAQHPYSKYCIEFLERFKNAIKQNGDLCELEWTHLPSEEESKVFDDGFSDDYVFDPEKIYPRLKYNFANNPFESVEIMMPNNNPDSDKNGKENNMPMFRVWDKYVICLIQDVGNVFKYITYDDIPQGCNVEQLEKKAFENLERDVDFRLSESVEHGVYGILAGGNFEAESLLKLDIWSDVSQNFGSDLFIAAPTKDMILVVSADQSRAVKKMLKFAGKIFSDNMNSSRELIFTKDIFMYSRDTKQLEISSKYSL